MLCYLYIYTDLWSGDDLVFDCTIAIDCIKGPNNCDVSTSKVISNSGIRLLLDLDFIQGDIPNQFCKNLLYFITHKDCPKI